MGELPSSLMHWVGLSPTWCNGWDFPFGGVGRLLFCSALVSSSSWWGGKTSPLQRIGKLLLLGRMGGLVSYLVQQMRYKYFFLPWCSERASLLLGAVGGTSPLVGWEPFSCVAHW